MLDSSFLCFGANTPTNYFWSSSHCPLVFFITLECNTTLQWSENYIESVLFHCSVFSFLQSEMVAGCHGEGIEANRFSFVISSFWWLALLTKRWTLHFPAACLQCSTCSSAHLSFCDYPLLMPLILTLYSQMPMSIMIFLLSANW